jgi:hypothetical protein
VCPQVEEGNHGKIVVICPESLLTY